MGKVPTAEFLRWQEPTICFPSVGLFCDEFYRLRPSQSFYFHPWLQNILLGSSGG